jgi:hypothetical protein
MHVGLHVNYQLFLSNLDKTRIFSKDFQKKLKHFTKFLPVGAEFLHADGRTDRQMDVQAAMTKLSFSQILQTRLKTAKTYCCKQTSQIFGICGSVHHHLINKTTNVMLLGAIVFIIPWKALYMFRVLFTPIIRSVLKVYMQLLVQSCIGRTKMIQLQK